VQRILIVDDNFEQRQLIAVCLKDMYAYDVAASGTEAIGAFHLALSKGSPYALILLDVAMPGSNGLDVLKAIREYEEKVGIKLGEGIPIVMITGYKDTMVSAFNGGCDDYIVKPVKKEMLIAKIREKIEKTK
jgi:two-component system, chemotaxis family, chemotaxis protein CheY